MDLFELSQKFPTEVSVYDYFEGVRWVKKRFCAHCGVVNTGRRYSNFQYHCPTCRKRFSVLTKTHLHNTRMPLQKWLLAFAVISDGKKGISAKQLERNISVAYTTAFAMAHKMRDIMAIEKVEMLSELVEMDETFIGGKPRKPNVHGGDLSAKQIFGLESGLQVLKDAGFKLKRGKGNPAHIDLNTKRGRGSQKQIPVAGIVERDGAVVAEVMENLTALELKKMVEKYVSTDESVIITDFYKGYNSLHTIIEHIKIDHSKMYLYKGINTNSIESFWAIVERGIMGTYHHVSLKYLPKYVVEFVFKYNNRKSDDMFDTLVKASMNVPIPSAIIHPPKPRAAPKKKGLPF
jgi:transposase-like protein